MMECTIPPTVFELQRSDRIAPFSSERSVPFFPASAAAWLTQLHSCILAVFLVIASTSCECDEDDEDWDSPMSARATSPARFRLPSSLSGVA
ncbi:hypothetical protein MUK42_33268 [Musa troglodytarum]|uniref:Uncharacterized protein n=1 Tax=Musa troglodytarum TaxID=320322 RepID=A0A9E7HWK6_9LILI|nr:hypothetical protein MUK42_33268 [Musa troglodytarum]